MFFYDFPQEGGGQVVCVVGTVQVFATPINCQFELGRVPERLEKRLATPLPEDTKGHILCLAFDREERRHQLDGYLPLF